ncbi:MAG: ATP-dependent RNA helicase HrpA [Microbacteriaceae bacterium]|nr:ATP-dependent RNA helicase HrpA [Microbacteriaceae bacterium]
MSALPPIVYPPELPVSAAREQLARIIRENQVVIVAGETGSGKTTQLPKICLELGRERIGHTQPRRIAARSVAERIAQELGVELGGLVGYQVRFDDRSRAETRIKLMTDGVLLAELHRDRDLRRYDTIIIDEAHERSLTIDFLLGYLKQLLPRRPDLKVIVTSATIDPESFARHFADTSGEAAPIVEVSGRTYPVELRYRPLAPEGRSPSEIQETPGDSVEDAATSADQGPSLLNFRRGSAGGDGEVDVLEGITAALDELEREEPGDVLVFLSGEAEIRDAQDALSSRPGAEVVPLYGRLSAADQHRVFETKRKPGIRRRIVLATNVAETSLTVPGIKYVVDAGTARISRYSSRAKVQRLPIEAISQASANQRSGRAGRTSDGIAIRLYSEEDFARRPEFTDPEILRTNLAAVILQMMAIGLGDIEGFPFLQPPDRRGIQDGLDLLRELGAIARDRVSGGDRITKIGRELATLPVDPRFGRMLVEARRTGVVREVVAIVAGLSIQDPRERPLDKRPQADQAHARFTDPTSDFLALLNLWNHLEERQKELSSSAFRRMCTAEFVNYLRVREWQDLYRQILRAGGLKAGAPRIDADGIHKALLSGLLSRIGLRDERAPGLKAGAASGRRRDADTDARPGRREYLGARGARFAIFPGSGLAKKAPPAVMAAELVETSRLFARTVASIDPAWAEVLAGDLVKRSYGEPRWEKKQGSAVADEKVTLYGVPIVPKRRVQLGRIDPEQARELFIRHALVDGDWPYAIDRNPLYAFVRRNRELRAELGEVEERTRRRDILVDDEAVVEFYDRRLPAQVTDVRAFERWAKDAGPEALVMTRSDLLDDADLDGLGTREEDYPAEWVQGDQRLRLSYRFEPGADDDGVTVEIPLALLPRVEPEPFTWLVPGLRDDLVTALLKALPKPIRKNVVPAADWARRLRPAAEELREGSVQSALAEAIRAQTHTPTTPEDFDLGRVPPHLRMTFAAVDGRGKRLGTSKDLADLQSRFAERSRTSVAKATAASGPDRSLERAGITSWDLGDLPEAVEGRADRGTVRGYPALVDDARSGGGGGSPAGTGSVSVRVFATAADQTREHRHGVRRLLALMVPSPLGYVDEHLTQTEKLVLAASPYRSTAALLDDALLAVLDEAIGESAPFTRAGFEALRERASAGLMDALFGLVADVAKVLAAARDADRTISAASSMAFLSPLGDARAQLDALVFPGFVRITGMPRMRRLPVYLGGIVHRVQRLPDNPGRDRQWQTEVEQATALYREAGGVLPLASDTELRLAEVRWMLEELRLSLFAQHLGAAGPVSVQRIRKALAA